MILKQTQASFREYLSLTYSSYDCYDLVKLFYRRELEIDLISDDYLSPNKTSLHGVIRNKDEYKNLVQVQKRNFKRVGAPQYGDIILFSFCGIASHVGIYLEDNLFLHTQEKTGACIEKLSNQKWQKRLLGIYRYDQDKAQSVR
jgi:cell wall-associated NlpC family hydrolase